MKPIIYLKRGDALLRVTSNCITTVINWQMMNGELNSIEVSTRTYKLPLHDEEISEEEFNYAYSVTMQKIKEADNEGI